MVSREEEISEETLAMEESEIEIKAPWRKSEYGAYLEQQKIKNKDWVDFFEYSTYHADKHGRHCSISIICEDVPKGSFGRVVFGYIFKKGYEEHDSYRLFSKGDIKDMLREIGAKDVLLPRKNVIWFSFDSYKKVLPFLKEVCVKNKIS